MEPSDLSVRDGAALGLMRQLQVRDQQANWFTLGDPAKRELASLDFLLMRKDPPFDLAYIYTTYILDLAELAGVLVVNRPQSLRMPTKSVFLRSFRVLRPRISKAWRRHLSPNMYFVRCFGSDGWGVDFPGATDTQTRTYHRTITR
jgi:hypothetical protein